MDLKFTQFNSINSGDSKWDEKGEWKTIMEESETLFCHGEPEAEFSPSDHAINMILNFARTSKTVPSINLEYIDLYMN